MEINPINLFYNNKYFSLPKSYLENLDLLFDEKNLVKYFDSDEKALQNLVKFLPANIENPKEFIISLLSKKNEISKDTVQKSPIETFKNMYKNNYFSQEYQIFFQRLKLESLEEYIESYQNTYSYVKNNAQKYHDAFYMNSPNFQNSFNENLESSQGGQENNIFDEFASFDSNPEIASSGYTTIISNNEEKDNFTNNQNNFANTSYKDMKNFLNNNLNEFSNGNKFVNEDGMNLKNMNNPHSTNLDANQGNDRFKTLKINKNQLTIRPRTKDEIKEFQRQEIERYKKPHLPWKYINSDGSSSVVAPVQKKIPTSGQTKPRDHVLLKADRPSYVTILCLARDAAARLPEGVGTRADICELLKDSQYTNERLSDTQINNIVSGALDRLHYEKDPCVKYDLQKKLWIYLHKNRDLDYEPWNEHLKKNNLDFLGNPINPNLNVGLGLNAESESNGEECDENVNEKQSDIDGSKDLRESSNNNSKSLNKNKNSANNLISICNNFDLSDFDVKLNEDKEAKLQTLNSNSSKKKKKGGERFLKNKRKLSN